MKFKKVNYWGTHRRAYVKGADVVTIAELPNGKASAEIEYGVRDNCCVTWKDSPQYISRKELAAWLKVNRPRR